MQIKKNRIGQAIAVMLSFALIYHCAINHHHEERTLFADGTPAVRLPAAAEPRTQGCFFGNFFKAAGRKISNAARATGGFFQNIYRNIPGGRAKTKENRKSPPPSHHFDAATSSPLSPLLSSQSNHSTDIIQSPHAQHAAQQIFDDIQVTSEEPSAVDPISSDASPSHPLSPLPTFGHSIANSIPSGVPPIAAEPQSNQISTTSGLKQKIDAFIKEKAIDPHEIKLIIIRKERTEPWTIIEIYNKSFKPFCEPLNIGEINCHIDETTMHNFLPSGTWKHYQSISQDYQYHHSFKRKN